MRRNMLKVTSLVLILVLIGSTALAASLSDVLSYEKGQGYSVKSTTTNTGKKICYYIESTTGTDKLVWTSTTKTFTVSVSAKTKKAKLRATYAHIAKMYSWQAAYYKIDGVKTYGYKSSSPKTAYSTLSAYRTAVQNRVDYLAKKRTYILNTSSMKFHLSTCSDASRIAAKNKDTVKLTRDSVLNKGYTPCKHCNP